MVNMEPPYNFSLFITGICWLGFCPRAQCLQHQLCQLGSNNGPGSSLHLHTLLSGRKRSEQNLWNSHTHWSLRKHCRRVRCLQDGRSSQTGGSGQWKRHCLKIHQERRFQCITRGTKWNGYKTWKGFLPWNAGKHLVGHKFSAFRQWTVELEWTKYNT